MKSFILSALALAATGLVACAPANAADNIMKVCGAKYQTAKSSKTLPAGQTWNQYLAACRGSTPKTGPAAPVAAPVAAAPVAKPATRSIFAPAAHPAPVAAAPAAPASGKPQSAGMAAMHDRQRQCGAQWKADKAAGKVAAGQTWPKYWSACNTRLKG